MTVQITIPNEKMPYTAVIIDNRTGQPAVDTTGIRSVHSCDFALTLAAMDETIACSGMGKLGPAGAGELIQAFCETIQKMTAGMKTLSKLRVYAEWKAAGKQMAAMLDGEDIADELAEIINGAAEDEEDEDADEI